MPSGSMLPYGNCKGMWVLACTLSPSSVAATTSAEQTFTVTGLALGDATDVSKPTLQAGLGVASSRCSAANTLAITFVNTSNAVITPTASEVYTVSVTRPDTLDSKNNSIVTNLV